MSIDFVTNPLLTYPIGAIRVEHEAPADHITSAAEREVSKARAEERNRIALYFALWASDPKYKMYTEFAELAIFKIKHDRWEVGS